jgi:hypothetical protein
VFLHFVFYFVYSVFFFVSFHLLYCLFPIFVQVYRPLPASGNPVAANKYHVVSFPIVWCLVCGHEFSLSFDGVKFGFFADQNARTDPQGLSSCPDDENYLNNKFQVGA